MGGNGEVLQVLLDNKADINAPIQNANGETTGLREAARAGHLDVIKLLLGAKALVDGSAGEGAAHPPICEAASAGNLEAVKLLLRNKADPWIKTEDGASAIALALQNAHLHVFRDLLDKPDFPAADFRDLLARALRQKDIEFLSSLLDSASTLDPDFDLNQ